MPKKCLDCKSKVIDDLESDMENVVPLWYKKEGNYSLLPKALNCDNKYNATKVDLKEETPRITDIEVKVPIKTKANTWVFYWAAQPQKDAKKINEPSKAYGKEKNSGLLKTNKKGEVKLVLNCPQPYKVEEITYPRHVHYVTLTDDDVWDTNVKTAVVICKMKKNDLKEVLTSKTHFVINALPKEYHDKKSIPDSLNLPQSSITTKNRDKKIKTFMRDNLGSYPELEKLVDDKKLSLKDVPIVTYCAHKDCNASEKLLMDLMNAGFSNVLEYPGGTKEWFNEKDEKSTDKPSFFEDTSSTDDKYNLDIQKEKIVIDGIIYTHNLENDELYDNEDELIGLWDGKKIKWESEIDDKKHQTKINNLKNKDKEDKEQAKHKEQEDEEEEEQKDKEKEEEEKHKEQKDEEEEKHKEQKDEEEEGEEDEEKEKNKEQKDEEKEEHKEQKDEDKEEEEKHKEQKDEVKQKEESSSDEELSSDEEEKKEEKEEKPIDQKIQKLKNLLKSGQSGGGRKKKENDFNFQKDGLYIKNTNNITEKRFNKEFQGWGFTFF